MRLTLGNGARKAGVRVIESLTKSQFYACNSRGRTRGSSFGFFGTIQLIFMPKPPQSFIWSNSTRFTFEKNFWLEKSFANLKGLRLFPVRKNFENFHFQTLNILMFRVRVKAVFESYGVPLRVFLALMKIFTMYLRMFKTLCFCEL